MIITDRFVFVHHPKTGETLVTSALLRIHGLPLEAGGLRDKMHTVFETSHGQVIMRGPKHYACKDIPAAHRGQKVLGVVRNPYDRYVSSYEYGWWKEPEYLEQYRDKTKDLDQLYPGFPDISFRDFLDFQNLRQKAAGSDVGSETVAFIRRYFKEPRRVLANLREDDFSSGRYRQDMFDVHFLRTDCLNQGLHAFLLAVGYPAGEIAFLLELGKILPGIPAEVRPRLDPTSREAYCTPESQALMRHRERHLFTLFPEFERHEQYGEDPGLLNRTAHPRGQRQETRCT